METRRRRLPRGRRTWKRKKKNKTVTGITKLTSLRTFLGWNWGSSTRCHGRIGGGVRAGVPVRGRDGTQMHNKQTMRCVCAHDIKEETSDLRQGTTAQSKLSNPGALGLLAGKAVYGEAEAAVKDLPKKGDTYDPPPPEKHSNSISKTKHKTHRTKYIHVSVFTEKKRDPKKRKWGLCARTSGFSNTGSVSSLVGIATLAAGGATGPINKLTMPKEEESRKGPHDLDP